MLKSLFRCWSPALVVIVGLSVTAAVAAPKPSFPCSKRMSPDEKAICEDPRLTTLDRIANQGYLFLRAKLGKAEANKINLPLIRQRQKCKADVVCIEKAQRESIRLFNQNGARLEIPDFEREEAVKSEPNVPENPTAAAPEPAPSEPMKTSQTNPAENPTPPAASPEPAPSSKQTAPTEMAAPADKTPAPVETTEADATPAPPPATAAELEDKDTKSAGEPEEPIDQPPVESESKTASNDNSPSQDNADAGAGATPNPKGAREWRPEIEKELRAESELESRTTDTLTREIEEAEQIKPLTREQRQALESTRSKHRTAFMLAAILFALVVAYAISKLKRDPGLIASAAGRATPTHSAATIKNPPSAASAPPSATRPAALVSTKNDPTLLTSAAGVRPTIETSPTPASTQSTPSAWVWTHYKGKI